MSAALVSGGDAHGEAADRVPDLVPVHALSIGPLTIETPRATADHDRAPLLNRMSPAYVRVAVGTPWASAVEASALVSPSDRERMGLALAPWLCPRYQEWEATADHHASEHDRPDDGPPAGHGKIGACGYTACRAVTTAHMLAGGSV